MYLIVFILFPDINECDVGIHNCHKDATCFNTHGSFNCSCNNDTLWNSEVEKYGTGFEGNGTHCQGIEIIEIIGSYSPSLSHECLS